MGLQTIRQRYHDQTFTLLKEIKNKSKQKEVAYQARGNVQKETDRTEIKRVKEEKNEHMKTESIATGLLK